MKIKNKGFSLTEIIITILIIAVLSAISGPIYNSYSTKTKQAEGYLLLGAIKDAQMKRYASNGSFLTQNMCGTGWNDFVSVNNIFGIDARANKYYTLFNVGNSTGTDNNIKFKAYVKGDGVLMAMYYNVTLGTRFYENANLWNQGME
ncbi:MAG: prepilin-type N-terminal cleavage/methylation domain-containing protein [Elusimicrobia bacterium]|nr:prepilin-type N-terminal cleavage/methylation domain-containing protein [Elusimicrobiota bacterium]